MDERFLRYAMEKERPIRAVWLADGVMRQKTVRVLDVSADAVRFRLGRKGKPFDVPLADVLACDYARGDDGDA